MVEVDRRNCWEVLHGKSEQAVELARQGCTRAAARVEQLESQLSRLQTLQTDYSARLRAAQELAQGMSQSASYRSFLAQIGGLMERTMMDLSNARAVLSAARRELLRCEQEQSKYEALIEREDLRAHREADDIERRAMEELAISRFLQQKRA